MWFRFSRQKKGRALIEEHTNYRIVKEEWPDGTVYFQIEEWTQHYACEEPFWMNLHMYYQAAPHNFSTHEEASTYLTKMLMPPPVPIKTVVEER